MGDDRKELKCLETALTGMYFAIMGSTNPAAAKTRFETEFDRTYGSYLELAAKCQIPEGETRDVKEMYRRIFGQG